MHNAALAELGPGGGVELRGDRRRARRLRARWSRDCPDGDSSAPTSPSPTRARRWRSPTPSRRPRARSAPPTRSASTSGEVRADNTDAAGLLAALPELARGRRALVLGAGGAARAVVWALVREGAEVEVWNRTALRSRNLCEELGGAPVERPRPGRLRADRQLDRGRPAAARTRSRSCRCAPTASPPARSSSTWSTAGEPTALLGAPPRRPARRRSTGSRSSSARGPSRCRSGPAASRRSTRCAPPRLTPRA